MHVYTVHICTLTLLLLLLLLPTSYMSPYLLLTSHAVLSDIFSSDPLCRCVARYEDDNVKKPVILIDSGPTTVEEVKDYFGEDKVVYVYVRLVRRTVCNLFFEHSF